MTTAFEENKGISLARFFQGITSWHLKRPPIDGAAGAHATGTAAAGAAAPPPVS